MSNVKLSEIIAPPFFAVQNSIDDRLHTSYWLKGGRGSTKSSFVAIQIILGIIQDQNVNAVCVRKVSDTIRTSILTTFQWAIDKLEVNKYFRVITSPPEITYLPTGQKIIMKGLDDPQKLKSIRASKGYFKYLWFEEGAEFTDLEEMESVTQSVLRGGQEFVEFVTYNPPAEPFAWINEEARRPRSDRLVHESNYKQVDPAWLGPKFIADAEEMERTRPEKYAHIYMGEQIGRAEAIVFSGCYRVESFEAVKDDAGTWRIGGKQADGPYLGADFGFAQDPNTLVRCFIVEKELYIEYAEFGSEIMLDDMPKFYERVPDSRRYRIFGDSSRPETIAHLRARNFSIEAAAKWAGSVEDGIEVLKSYRIIIHPRCVELIEEARKYSYKVDRITRDVLPDLVDKHNHGWDAVRYALSKLIKKSGAGMGMLQWMADEVAKNNMDKNKNL